MRPLLFAVTLTVLAGCSAGRTPPCANETVTSRVTGLVRDAIESGLVQTDPAAGSARVMERLTISLTDIATTAHDETIDKHTCTAHLRVTLPSEIAALRNHHAFRILALNNTAVEFDGDDMVAPVTYTSYLNQDDRELIVRAEGEQAPARYIQAAYQVGAFDADLTRLPDLHGGLTLYSGPGKTLLIKPVEGGALQFHVNYERNQCRPWAQQITEERNDTLIYDNPEVGCSVMFSRLGEILLVEHKGCELMAASCSPDGVYRKQ